MDGSAALVRLALLGIGLLLSAADGMAAERRDPGGPIAPPYGPSYAAPYSFAKPLPIYPAPGGSLYEYRYGGARGYDKRRDDAAAPAPRRDASPGSQRLDTRLGPAH
jgi:hypothetical protein